VSEVLSKNLGIFPSDERQALRIGRFLMGAGTSALVFLVLVLSAFLGLLPWDAAIHGGAAIVALVALFFALFRTGLNLRLSDPSLTTEQVAAAILVLAYIMYHAGPMRGAFTVFYVVAMLFGVLRLNAARLMVLAVIALIAHGVVLQLSALRDPAMNLKAAVTEFAVLAIVLPWFAAMGGYVSRLRVRLSDSHRELKGALERMGEIAVRDELTGAYNRRFLMEALARERSRAERLGEPFAACLIDIDHFKSINDRLGHATGDAVLKQFAALAPRGLRGVDTFGRLGGEEFLLLLPGTGRAGALAAAERVRAAAEAAAFAGVPAERRVTVTVGVAIHAKGEDAGALLARADQALYQGKSLGRNRVVALG
jgi:diguanylate cyclase (GGDEF)-like protein